MTIRVSVASAIAISPAVALLALVSSTTAWADNKAATAPVIAKSRICLVLPKAQLGQGSSGADVAEPVRQTLLAYLTGPATELIPLSARIPIQVDAEAQQTGCEYVLYTSVTQKKGGGFGKLLAAAAPLASVLPGIGGMGGNYGAMMAAQGMASAAASAATQSAQEEAMAALNGATQANIKKGDQVTLEYKLMKPGLAAPFATKSAAVKAEENGEDLLSPLIEQTATEVLTAVSQPAA